MLTALLASTALATGFYHPNDVASASTRFAEAQSQLLAPLDERQAQARRISGALRAYREGIDALGSSVPEEQVARLETAETAYLRRFDALQTFADTLVGDFDGAFTAALQRALATHPGATECVREVSVGPRVPGMGGRTQKNPECQGADLNAQLTAAIDADAELATALPGIVGRPWPTVDVTPVALAPIGGGDRHLQVQVFLATGAGKALRAIDNQDDDDRMAIEAKLEDGADAAELTSLGAMGEQISKATADKRAALATPIVAAANNALEKWAKSEGTTGWCVQPAALGGCTGADATADLVQRLLADKKVDKALP